VDDATYYGLAPGKVAGLRYAGYVKVTEVVRAPDGSVAELRAEYDHERSRTSEKVKGNLHWVSSAVPGAEPPTAEVRLYDYLFTVDEPGASGDWEAELNPRSEVVLTGCPIDASLAGAGRLAKWDHFQFERVGYFVADQDSDFAAGKLVFNQTVSLKESVATKNVRSKN
jgi:glutaminyl-tRNA synthetase